MVGMMVVGVVGIRSGVFRSVGLRIRGNCRFRMLSSN
jgi:hypothetical protein